MPERPISNLMEEFRDKRPVSIYRAWLLSLLTKPQQDLWRGYPIEKLTPLVKIHYASQGGTWR